MALFLLVAPGIIISFWLYYFTQHGVRAEEAHA